jgi:hypothetical protein
MKITRLPWTWWNGCSNSQNNREPVTLHKKPQITIAQKAGYIAGYAAIYFPVLYTE